MKTLLNHTYVWYENTITSKGKQISSLQITPGNPVAVLYRVKVNPRHMNDYLSGCCCTVVDQVEKRVRLPVRCAEFEAQFSCSTPPAAASAMHD